MEKFLYQKTRFLASAVLYIMARKQDDRHIQRSGRRLLINLIDYPMPFRLPENRKFRQEAVLSCREKLKEKAEGLDKLMSEGCTDFNKFVPFLQVFGPAMCPFCVAQIGCAQCEYGRLNGSCSGVGDTYSLVKYAFDDFIKALHYSSGVIWR